MQKYLMLAKLQIKGIFKSLPKILLGTVLFAVIVVLAGICSSMMFENTDDASRMRVAVVVPETNSDWENEQTNLTFNFLGDIDTVKNVCEFEQTYDKEGSLRRLRNGELTAVILLPEEFVGGILNGTNNPAKIVFAKSGVNTESALFREMIMAGASDLSTAQAGVYALDDASWKYLKTKDKVIEVENQINNEYFLYALNRGIYFKAEKQDGISQLSTTQFYICTGIVMFFILSGITCVSLLHNKNRTLNTALYRRGIKYGTLNLFNILGITIVYFCILGFVYIMSGLASIRFPYVSQILKTDIKTVFTGLFGIFVLIFSLFSMVSVIFKATNSQVAGILVLFILSMVMMFASGCFMPASMLPSIVADAGKVLPTAYFFKLCGQILTGCITFSCIIINVIYSLVFLGITAVIERVNR